jgi:hypothetical protein
MGRHLKFSDRKALQRAFLMGRNRGKAAANRRMREERDQGDSESEPEQPHQEQDDN